MRGCPHVGLGNVRHPDSGGSYHRTDALALELAIAKTNPSFSARSGRPVTKRHRGGGSLNEAANPILYYYDYYLYSLPPLGNPGLVPGCPGPCSANVTTVSPVGSVRLVMRRSGWRLLDLSLKCSKATPWRRNLPSAARAAELEIHSISNARYCNFPLRST